MFDFKGKVAFITGGASGIGLGQAKVLAEQAGMKVVIADVQAKHLEEAAAYFKDKDVQVHIMHLDVTDRTAYAAAALEVEKKFGPVQVLMNTAGVSARGPLELATADDWDWHIDVNLRGVINGIQAFLPHMIEHGDGGHIVNTASISSFFVIPTAALYSTTKFAIRGLSESLRIELSQFDIGVSCLCPGSVNTNFMEVGVTRTQKYAQSGFVEDAEAVARVKVHLEAGFDPLDLAERTLMGMKRNDLWIFPYPEYIPSLEAKHKLLIDSINQWKDDPAYAVRLQKREEMGLGKPKLD
ncbi:NADP-dependent 3-hydroxy acid dehydrogenase YdfG [Paraburkholderia sp. BL23I1N1]|uniref:SDR family oxidoreductase n=1 Tax=unclassified Paraburkholderia TaxID=2615204 RepID=UPI000E740584|nr:MULTISPECIES: SDR family NAD(P)-dependent oxidoreductase [unclassified Paraburkholderia]RKE23852.1 NADP-dependent 3-hydroxy acid dehydrogenase YdfG [Paraburkholderia sp. BL23I1N1]TDY15594.1 NADP-dependent 3-hydroxy acid dehydrogenase YdfG [Paraburkholderia sp. BL6665CI2N2]